VIETDRSRQTNDMKCRIENTGANARKLRVLCLLHPHYLYINTIREHLESLGMFSHHEWSFTNSGWDWNVASPADDGPPLVDFSQFDVVVVHYCSRVCFDHQFSPMTLDALRRFSGCKCLFIQDEYDHTGRARDWIRDHGVNLVFTVVPEPFIAKVYPPEMLPGVKFVPVLTGYVPVALERSEDVVPLASRKFAIAYRGREMPFIYGELGREKLDIGIKVRERCEQRGIPVDIEWKEDKRIYGRDWNRFLHSAKATLGTESGCNVFDVDGTIRAAVEAALTANAHLRYEDVRGTYFEDENIGVRMNQISPKFFEFIAARTAIIALEGEYSNIIEPDRHYLALKKDYSNLDEILDRLEDLPFLEAMTRRAYEDVVASGRYSWRAFANIVDTVIDAHHPSISPLPIRTFVPHNTPPPHWYRGSISLHRNERTQIYQEFIDRNLAIIADHEGMIQRRQAKIAKLEAAIDAISRRDAGNHR